VGIEYPAEETDARRRSGLLGDVQYDYTPARAGRRCQHAPLPPRPVTEEVVPVEEYQPTELTEEEAIQKTLEDSELVELAGVVQLRVSAIRAAVQ
jgi:hypothetical protein